MTMTIALLALWDSLANRRIRQEHAFRDHAFIGPQKLPINQYWFIRAKLQLASSLTKKLCFTGQLCRLHFKTFIISVIMLMQSNILS